MSQPKRVRVVSPCVEQGVRFEDRADGTRFCLHCREVTHDLREATRGEAAAPYHANGGKLCAMVRVGPSGEVRFRPEPPPRGLSSLGGAALALAVAACEPEASSQSITPSPETTSAPVAAPPPEPVAAPTPEPVAAPTPEPAPQTPPVEAPPIAAAPEPASRARGRRHRSLDGREPARGAPPPPPSS